MSDRGQYMLQSIPGLFVSDRFQGAGRGPCFEDTFNGFGVESLISVRMGKCSVNILTVVMLFKPENGTCMEAGITSKFVLQPGKERFGVRTQLQEAFPDRFQAVPQFLADPMIRVLHLLARPLG